MPAPSARLMQEVRRTIGALISAGHGFSDEFYALNQIEFDLRHQPSFRPVPTADDVRTAVAAGRALQG